MLCDGDGSPPSGSRWIAPTQADNELSGTDEGYTRRSRGAVIYLDSSVALAHLLAEDRAPPKALWQQSLIASRLIEYEVWNRINSRKLGRSHGEETRALLDRVALIELAPAVLDRALEPFPSPVRTLDALASGLDRVPPRSRANHRAGEL